MEGRESPFLRAQYIAQSGNPTLDQLTNVSTVMLEQYTTKVRAHDVKYRL